jgi:hypothetical protein
MRLSFQQVLERISDGKIFSAEFVKKDGSIRTMTCRRGVVKHLKGGELKFDPVAKGLIPVFDMANGGYRFINFNTLRKIKFVGAEVTEFDGQVINE